MHWITFAIGAALSWGLYGPMMHQGQMKLGSPFRALLCASAPVINAFYTMWLHPPKVAPNPMLWAGMVMVSVGAALVLYYKPAA